MNQALINDLNYLLGAASLVGVGLFLFGFVNWIIAKRKKDSGAAKRARKMILWGLGMAFLILLPGIIFFLSPQGDLVNVTS
jgi:VIT1/CCC1 family predicted Fe2+/Mn2+ transporter